MNDDPTSRTSPSTGAPEDKPSPVSTASPTVTEFLAKRRSASKNDIVAPGPNERELAELLHAASRVPDHRKLGPWRFIVFEGEARERFGEIIEATFTAKKPDANEKQRAVERTRFLRAPVVVTIVSSPVDDGRTPIWEQELSAGALCYNLLLSARASGWASVWLTEWIAYDENITKALGLTETERVAGFVYLGSSDLHLPERLRPDVAERTLRWKA